MRWITWLSLLGTGCAQYVEVPTSVSAIPELHLSVAGSRWTATLGDELMDFHPAPCPKLLPDLMAVVDQHELAVVEPGVAVPAFDGGQACVPPRLEGDVPPRAGASQLVLRDDVGTITCDIPDLAGTRSIALLPPGPWEFRAGQSVTVEWSPSPNLAITSPYVLVRSGTNSLSGTDVTVTDGLLTFTVPPTPPGPYQLEIRTRSRASCRSSQAGVDLDATISTSNVSQPITIVL